MKRFLATALLLAVAMQALANELELPFERAHPREAILVQAKVNGKPATLILDTGADHTIVQPDLVGMNAAELKMSQFSATQPGLRGGAVWATASVRLGSRTWHDRHVVVMNLAEVSRVYGRRVDGILGQDLLTEFEQVIIDYKAKRIRLRK